MNLHRNRVFAATIPVLLFLVAPIALDAQPSKPNVLFIVSDDLATTLGCYGNEVCETPNLDRLASEGVLFERAYCQYPVCGPSRASFMSGLYPDTTKVLSNKSKGSRLYVSHPSIGELLRQDGYFSARVSKIYHMGVPGGIEAGEPGGDKAASWDWAYNVIGPETRSAGGYELLSPKRTHAGSNFGRVIVPDELEATQTDVLAAQQAIAILENRSTTATQQPFFLAVGFVRPHVPLVAPQRLFEKYPDGRMKIPTVPEGDLHDVPPSAAEMENNRRYGMDEAQQRKAIAGYYASISFMDEQVGKLLLALDRLQLRENTLVIFTSDHGYSMGEHGLWQKLSLFEESTRVPLLISAPGFEASAGKRAAGIVELIDLYPTIAEVIGIEAPDLLQGTSLRPLLENPERDDWSKTVAFSVTHRDGASIRTLRWRYNAWGQKGEELYDLENDPGEFTNLAKEASYETTLKEMRALLDETQKRATK